MTTVSIDQTRTDNAVSQQPKELSFERTIDRQLVHRDSLGEVFVTDLREGASSGSYLAAAQLPRSHAYYGDHMLRPHSYDPILLLETARQAALAGAHAFFGVPRSHKFILTHLRIHLAHPELTTVGDSPFALHMDIRTGNIKLREGRTVGLDYEVRMSVAGVMIGQASVGLRFKSPESYTRLRTSNRNGRSLPSSASPIGQVTGTLVDPALVGRTSPENVVLLDADSSEAMATAALHVPGGHPSMFDHPQDHIPGMVLAEAARQLALFTALDMCGISAARTLLTDLSVVFTKFGELDEKTTLSAFVESRRGEDPEVYYTQGGALQADALTSRELAEQIVVNLTALQGGEPISKFSLSLGRLQGR
ncbi:ScbA/BarX family gamma-butyrolactone biosynthesis protein [Streptomyces vilmorinianum]|uniref:ScbA/BarX family gamma-butyrolactone biosynthesis protein n=1 Tax=Streptomyces vilmorinianum TaxID=3051092 RepID=UPI0015867693|nr:ScbA/BarX family gamma-butyrolactone biosynthesis protein [Streptomyces vilmorinianum]